MPDDVLKLLPDERRRRDGQLLLRLHRSRSAPAAAARCSTIGSRTAASSTPTTNDYRSRACSSACKENPIPRGSVHNVVDHIEHIIKIAGIDHVGLGSDYDGITTTPEQLEDVSTYPRHHAGAAQPRAIRRSRSIKILGGNLLRAMRRMEEVAK